MLKCQHELWHLFNKQTTRIRGKAISWFQVSMLSFPQSMSSNECETRIKLNKCEDENMVCNDNTCYIKAVDDKVTMFEGIRGPCHANDLYCPMPYPWVIIWSDHMWYQDFFSNTLLSATAIHLLFQLERVEIHCNIEGYTTLASSFHNTHQPLLKLF